MPNKQTILENVEMYSSDELIGFIKRGKVTFDEICNETDGCFPASKRKEVLHKLECLDDEAWKIASKKSEDIIIEPIPSLHIGECIKRIPSFEYDVIYRTIVDYWSIGKINHSDLLDMLKSDHNILPSSVVMMLLDNGYLDYNDFDKIGIDLAFIRHLVHNDTTQCCEIPPKLDKINKLSTEIYFWGLPASGKTSAIGAILSAFASGNMAKSMSISQDCQGYGWMCRMLDVFKKGQVSSFLNRAHVDISTEMGFDIVDYSNAIHPLTIINLSGDLCRNIYKYEINECLCDYEMEVQDSLTSVLVDNRTKNRKVHFFVIEYGAENQKYEGLTPNVYLDGVLRYIERKGIFKEDTDAIYVMITKIDKIKEGKEQLEETLRKYISDNYRGFYNGLVKICKDWEINNGKVEVVPFSLGQVCFQDYCLFDDEYAKNVIHLLLGNHSIAIKQNPNQKLKNFLVKLGIPNKWLYLFDS